MSRIVVRTNNILNPPLLDTNDASIIEFRGDDGQLTALFVAYPSNYWLFVTREDEDWQASLTRYGYK